MFVVVEDLKFNSLTRHSDDESYGCEFTHV